MFGTKKTGGITPGLGTAGQPCQIFQREQDGEQPLGRCKSETVSLMQVRHAVGHDDTDAAQDQGNQQQVKAPTSQRVRFKNDGVPAQTPARQRACRRQVCGPVLHGAEFQRTGRMAVLGRKALQTSSTVSR